ncbi:MAG: hypothetical protein KatS3mg089_0288 [Patescibacteria group bacterium]|nr:MAG: hypothetical protein KatS3mg089_0288 [Patescibacteria group bacterium]
MDQTDNQNSQANPATTDTVSTNSNASNSNPQSVNIDNSQVNSQIASSMPPFQTNDQVVENTSVNPQTEEDYITNVGQSMIDLLTDISNSDVRKQKIATEMRISIEQVTTICNRLLDKIDSGELTEEDLAFLIASPIADASLNQEEPSI